MLDKVEFTEDGIVETYKPPFTVKLTYFKESGKYYAEGKCTTNHKVPYKTISEVRDMLARGVRPGLVDGANEFYVLVEMPDHPLGISTLIMPTPINAADAISNSMRQVEEHGKKVDLVGAFDVERLIK